MHCCRPGEDGGHPRISPGDESAGAREIAQEDPRGRGPDALELLQPADEIGAAASLPDEPREAAISLQQGLAHLEQLRGRREVEADVVTAVEHGDEAIPSRVEDRARRHEPLAHELRVRAPGDLLLDGLAEQQARQEPLEQLTLPARREVDPQLERADCPPSRAVAHAWAARAR
jgi:hypothetical protein